MRMSRASLGWATVGILLVLHGVFAESPAAPEFEPGPLRRLVGPFAGLAADVQWVRFERARRTGRPDLATPAVRAYEYFTESTSPEDVRRWLAMSFLVKTKFWYQRALIFATQKGEIPASYVRIPPLPAVK